MITGKDPNKIPTDLPLLATGKPHVSFSEIHVWNECPWKHKLIYIDKVQDEEIISPYLDYGTIIHGAIENFLMGNPIDIEGTKLKLKEVWDLRGFDSEKFISDQTDRAHSQGWKYKHAYLETWQTSAEVCLTDLPKFLDEKFPGWKPVSSEFFLYEKLDDTLEGYFKGYIDCIIELPNGKHIVVDWKTASPRGWSRDKKQDILVTSQLILYKKFWMDFTKKSSRDIKTAFVLLKRETKPGKSIDIVDVSSGPKMKEKSEKLIRQTLSGMKRSHHPKNRMSCKFCEFFNTEHCKMIS